MPWCRLAMNVSHECVDVSATQPIVVQAAIEVAVVADRGAERDVEVERDIARRLGNGAFDCAIFQRAEIGGVRYSHIVNPQTGLGLTDHSLVTVVAPTGMIADALSKVISVLGPGPGIELANHYGADVFVLRQPGTVVEETLSPGFPRWLAPR